MALLTLNRTDYPGIDPVEVGNVGRRGYGVVEDVRIPAIEAGAASDLAATIGATDTTATVVDGSRFPAAPFDAQIGGEIVTVGAISGNTLSSITRGLYGTASKAHGAGCPVFEVRDEYVYQVSDQAVKAIGAVYVDGVKQDAASYTAYTGQAGDEHADYPGEAVVAFPARHFVGRQRGSGAAGNTSASVAPIYCSEPTVELATQTTVGLELSSSGLFKNVFWAAWAAGVGEITGDVIQIGLENPTGIYDGTLLVSARRTDTGATLAVRQVRVLGPGLLEFTIPGGVWPVQLHIVCESGSVTVLTLERVVTTKPSSAEPEAFITVEQAPTLASPPDPVPSIYDGVTGNPLLWVNGPYALGPTKNDIHTAQFDTTSLGDAVACVASFMAQGMAAENSVFLCALNGETLLVREEIPIPFSDAPAAYSVTVPGGGWNTRLVLVGGVGITIASTLRRQITYIDTERRGADLSGATSARVVIGDRVTVDASWHYDTDGTYGGAGNLIERPDWVIKHFLRNYMGAAAGEIDATSFSAAGTLYAAAITGGYKLQGIIPKALGWDVLKRMAFDCRSTVRFLGGKYYLSYTPDAAPAASRTLTTADLVGAGGKFVFTRPPTRTVFNDVTALYSFNYSGDTTREVSSGFLGIATDEDAASIAKYGRYKTEYQLLWVRSSTMAAHVLAHHLLERSLPLLQVTGTLFWEHDGLAVGDTIGITNDIYSGRKWWVSSVQRRDQFHVDFIAVEWYA